MEAQHSAKHSRTCRSVSAVLQRLRKKISRLPIERRRKVLSMLNSADDSEATALEEALRAAIVADGRTLYAIAKDAGLKQIQVARFSRGERTIGLPIAGRLCDVLRLELRPAKRKTR